MQLVVYNLTFFIKNSKPFLNFVSSFEENLLNIQYGQKKFKIRNDMCSRWMAT